MNRRTTLTLASIALALLFLAAVLAAVVPKIEVAQSHPLIGTWKLNIAKSALAAPLRSQIVTFVEQGQNLLTNTAETIDARGRASKAVDVHIYDGKPHPTTGNPNYDSTAYTRTNANTVNYVRFRDGKSVETGSIVVSADGKTYTATAEGTVSGQQYSTVSVYDRQ
jgi:hypothetical protein